MGKVFCLYLVMLLFVITVTCYACLSGMNIKTFNIWKVFTMGIFCLLYFAALFHFCNYAHCFANIVRYQNILFEHMYGAFVLCYCLDCK